MHLPTEQVFELANAVARKLDAAGYVYSRPTSFEFHIPNSPALVIETSTLIYEALKADLGEYQIQHIYVSAHFDPARPARTETLLEVSDTRRGAY